VEPWLIPIVGKFAATGSHAIAVAVAFFIITALHIVLGELAPKSLALQRSEKTALWVVRPLALFLFLFRPAILSLNWLGNAVLRVFGLRPATAEESLHSPDELKLLVAQSRRAGLLQRTQQEVVERTFNLGKRRIRDIMTPRPDVEWVDANDGRDEVLHTLRACHHEQMLVSRGDLDEVMGIIRKQDLLDQLLDGKTIDPLAALHKPLVLNEATPILRVLEQFKARPVSMAIVIDEYGSLNGIITQTDLLEAIAGDLSGGDEQETDIVPREDGSLLLDGLAPVVDVFDRLKISRWPEVRDFNTIAGFALQQFARIPAEADHFRWEGWRFEVVDMDGHRIDKLLATPVADHDPSTAEDREEDSEDSG
ncbi:MAG: hemolysin family protein, partial [Rhodanobacteraceae bacterium]